MGNAKADGKCGKKQEGLLVVFCFLPFILCFLKMDEPVDGESGKEGGEAADVSSGGLCPKSGGGAEGDNGRYCSPCTFSQPLHNPIDDE